MPTTIGHACHWYPDMAFLELEHDQMKSRFHELSDQGYGILDCLYATLPGHKGQWELAGAWEGPGGEGIVKKDMLNWKVGVFSSLH